MLADNLFLKLKGEITPVKEPHFEILHNHISFYRFKYKAQTQFRLHGDVSVLCGLTTGTTHYPLF